MKKLYPTTILLGIVIGACSLIVAFGTTSRFGVAQTLGLDGNGITIPFGDEVFDNQYGGVDVNFQECTSDGANDQKIYVAIDGKHMGVFYNTPAPADAYCWQTVERTDPTILAKTVQWMDRNARVAGYGILQLP